MILEQQGRERWTFVPLETQTVLPCKKMYVYGMCQSRSLICLYLNKLPVQIENGGINIYFHRWGAGQWQEVFSVQKREQYNWYKPIWKLACPVNYPKIPRLQELSEVGLRPQMLACGWTEVSFHSHWRSPGRRHTGKGPQQQFNRVLKETSQHAVNKESQTCYKITPISSFQSQRSQRYVKSFMA